jgi:preprotein translocase subunit Sec61beta
MNQPGSKRIVGIALLVSSAVLLVLAAIFWFSVVDVGPDIRPIVSAALFVGALADAAIGARLLQSSR